MGLLPRGDAVLLGEFLGKLRVVDRYFVDAGSFIPEDRASIALLFGYRVYDLLHEFGAACSDHCSVRFFDVPVRSCESSEEGASASFVKPSSFRCLWSMTSTLYYVCGAT
jgi:hypothetical protein